MRIVLLGDIHLAYRRAWPWQLMGKRALGMLNLWLNPHRRFEAALWPAVQSHIDSLSPDWLLWAGDLTATALPREFLMAQERLRPLMRRYAPRNFVVPGNHDRYTYRSARTHAFERAVGRHTARHWPDHRQIDPQTHLIGLDPTRPNWLADRGVIGVRQMSELKIILASIPRDHRIIVLCHYTLGPPPGDHESPLHRLRDEDILLEALSRDPHDICYVHGHVHRPWVFRHPKAPNVLCVNCGSPTLNTPAHPRGQGFWRLQTEQGWSLTRHMPDAQGRWQAVPHTI